MPLRIVVSSVGPYPIRIRCLTCNQEVLTITVHEPNFKTHICAILLCILGYVGLVIFNHIKISFAYNDHSFYYKNESHKFMHVGI